MSVSHLTVYGSFSRAGIPSDNANEVEQAMKQMVDNGVEGVRGDVRDLREQVLSKADGQVLRAEIVAELHKVINDLTIKMFGAMLASTGIIIAVVIKLAA
ncbi:MAG: hypothetical protein E6Q94_04955 [Burkholderiaceae bacterium]|nr:MAG: hypothetical protein E6Q94_04955 [Burkholderiaceae bacterium]